MSKIVKREGSKRVFVSFPSANIIENEEQQNSKIRVGAYCRVSTSSEEQLLSYHAQLEYYHDYLSNHKEYTFAGIYADEGISGTGMKKREGFQRMLDDCRNGKLDMIITKSVSRFGRNTVECLNVLRELKTLGIDVFFEKENIHSLQSDGEMLITLMMAVAEAECYNLSDNIKWGNQRRYEQGSVKSVGGNSPYGYAHSKDGYIIIKEEAIIIRRIFTEFLDGCSTNQIAKRLNNEGISSSQGGLWSIPSIMSILTNEKYKGDICYIKTFISDPITKKCIKNRGERNRYYLEGCHEGIIDKTQWECVQLELARRKQYEQSHHVNLSNNKGDAYPFTGKVICKECGYSFHMKNTNRIADNGIPRWRCGSFYKLRGKVDRSTYNCHRLWLDYDLPERVFIKAWNGLLPAEVDETDNVLIRHRKEQLNQLLKEYGQINKVPPKLVMKVLDHIVVKSENEFEVAFFCGEN